LAQRNAHAGHEWHGKTCYGRSGQITRHQSDTDRFLFPKITFLSLVLTFLTTGEGADEHFGGYKDLSSDFLLESDPSWPSAPSEQEIAGLADRLKALYMTMAKDVPLSKNRAPESTRRMLNNTSILTFLSLVGRMPFSKWTDIYAVTAPETAQAEKLDGRVRDAIANRWHPLHTAEYLFTKGFFSNLLLRYLGDNIDMVHHVETRPPFLDHLLAEYANGLPPSLKIKVLSDGSLKEKYILREAVQPFVTEEIYARQKKPYIGPTNFQENGPLHKLFLRLTSRENVDALGFVDYEETQENVRKAFQDKDHWSLRAAFTVCQLVVLSQRFGVAKATA
jgi:asparagine synthase (glutamine-hydrolysing)